MRKSGHSTTPIHNLQSILTSVASDVVFFVKAMQPGKHQDYVGQAIRRYQRPFPAMSVLLRGPLTRAASTRAKHTAAGKSGEKTATQQTVRRVPARCCD